MFTYMYYRPTVFNIQPRGRGDRGMCDKVVMVTPFPSHPFPFSSKYSSLKTLSGVFGCFRWIFTHICSRLGEKSDLKIMKNRRHCHFKKHAILQSMWVKIHLKQPKTPESVFNELYFEENVFASNLCLGYSNSSQSR